MRRSPMPQPDPAKNRAWRERGVKAWQDRQRAATPLNRSRTPKSPRGAPRRRNDAPWRAEVIAKRGAYCRRCGKVMGLQADHVISRSQRGPSVVENGMMLCGEPCHRLITEHKILYEFEWFDPDQIRWLAEHNHVAWDDEGLPYGRSFQNFAPRVGAR